MFECDSCVHFQDLREELKPSGPSETRVVETGGALPPFWDRSAIFVANLLGLFFGNEEQTRTLARMVGEVDSYGGRLVPILNLLYRGPQNLLILERAPDECLCNYFERVLGLNLPEQRILSHQDYLMLGRELGAGGFFRDVLPDLFAGINAHPATWIDGYVTDETLRQVASETGRQNIASPEGSHRGNNKRLLFEYLQSTGLPTVDTFLADSKREVARALEALRQEGFTSAVVKAAVGASGVGMIKVPSLEDPSGNLDLIPEYFFCEGACLVQGWLQEGEHGVECIRSPSVQLFLNEDTVFLYDCTEQILGSGSVHEGNIAPPPYLTEEPELRSELFWQAGEAGRWLHHQGYRGTASVDFLVVDRETGRSRTEVYVCEINARVTGATYPSVLARHFLPQGAWLLRNLRFDDGLQGADLLAMLWEQGHLFDPAKRTPGILPLNFNFGNDGLVHKGQFLCGAQSPIEAQELLDAARFDLPVTATDRD